MISDVPVNLAKLVGFSGHPVSSSVSGGLKGEFNKTLTHTI